MDTESLKLFVLAAERLNISAAGRALGMAPAVASARLAKLENKVGADLLRRSTRKVSLSVEGADFLPYARAILAQESAALEAIGHGNEHATGILRFASTSSFAQLYIAPLLPEFLERNPGVTLEMHLSDRQSDMIDGSFDLALRNLALDDSSFKCRKLADDRRVLCAAPAYLARHGVPREPEELLSHQLISFRHQSPRELISSVAPPATFDPGLAGSRLTIDDGICQKVATIAGAGISMNSLWNVHRHFRDGSLVRVLPDYVINDKAALWFLYPKSNVLTVKVRLFIDFLMERIGDDPPWLKPVD